MNAFSIILLICISLLIISACLCVYRALTSQSLFSRLLALEIIAFIVVNCIALWSLWLNNSNMLDLTLAITLIMFLSTTAYIHFILSRKTKHAHHQ